MKKLNVSVGIAAYNEEKNIGALLHSIIEQKKEGFLIKEIIVISDGSTDNTVSIIKNNPNKKIRLIEGNHRKGQNYRQNQIISLMSKESDCLLRLEADTIIKDSDFIKNLVSSIPSDGLYSVISGYSQPMYSSNLFSLVVLSGCNMRSEIFEKALSWPNLYIFEVTLLSKAFLKSFRWDKDFHEDSYCYRKAIDSKLPIIRNFKAILLFKLVDNIKDYLLQSSKFQKAKEKENEYSHIYKFKLNYIMASKIFFKHLLKHPIKLLLYLCLVIFSRIYSKKYSKYTPFWTIYPSSKEVLMDIHK